MMHPSTQKLLDKIAEMTRKKKIQWQESETGIDFPTEGYTVSLVGEPPAMLLSDKAGRVLEEVTAEDYLGLIREANLLPRVVSFN